MLRTRDLLWALAAVLLLGSSAEAGVAILCSRAPKEVAYSVVREDGKAIRQTLKPNDVVPIDVTERVGIAFDTSAGPRRYWIPANSIHFFVSVDGRLDLRKYELPKPGEEVRLPPPRPAPPKIEPIHTVKVMLLVDDDEPAIRRVWEKRLRDRLAEASEIIQQHCHIAFEVEAVGTWETDNKIRDFGQSLREFEMKVNPAPARLAIGFTSQYSLTLGSTHLGGTRGALHSHILIREWSQHVTKTERLEVLIHEIGHFLGASHTIDKGSVMRPVLGDGQSHSLKFRIGFDPINTMIMYLLGEELRSRRVLSLRSLHPATRYQLQRGYLALAEQMPDDPSVQNFLDTLTPGHRYVRPEPTTHPEALIEGTRAVVEAITAAARENRALSKEGPGASQLSGDRLTEYYVRRAAAAAAKLPADVAPKALLVGLGIGVGESSTLRYSQVGRDLCQKAEDYKQRRARLAVLGSPTMHDRRALAQRFFGSAAVSIMLSPEIAEATGINQELNNARRGGKFSFGELSADLAGGFFAVLVRDGKLTPSRLAAGFTIGDFLPQETAMTEGIPWQEFLDQFQSAQDERFHRQRAVIRQWILKLPGYRVAARM